MRRILVVANQTLGGDPLIALVRERLRAGPCEFWVVVPATAASQLVVRRSPGGSVMPASDQATSRPATGSGPARRRLEEGLARLRETGVRADGEVGDESPLKAIGAALATGEFDEIILSTLPTGTSRWLGQDLPRRIRRKFDLPVTLLVTDLPDLPRSFRPAAPAAPVVPAAGATPRR